MSNVPVRLMHYDPRWRQEFEQTRSSILSSCDGWVTDVEHIGGTAVPGMITRPTIDCVATVHDEESLQHAMGLLGGLNFGCVETPAWADGAITLVKPRTVSTESSDATHRVFLVVHRADQQESSTRNRSVSLRNFLRENLEAAIEWEERKVTGWKESRGSFSDYQAEKSLFFTNVEDQIDR